MLTEEQKQIALLGDSMWHFACDFWILREIRNNKQLSYQSTTRHNLARTRMFSKRFKDYVAESMGNLFPEDSMLRKIHMTQNYLETQIGYLAEKNRDEALEYCLDLLNTYVVEGWYDYCFDYWCDSISDKVIWSKETNSKGKVIHTVTLTFKGGVMSYSSETRDVVYHRILTQYYFAETLPEGIEETADVKNSLAKAS